MSLSPASLGLSFRVYREHCSTLEKFDGRNMRINRKAAFLTAILLSQLTFASDNNYGDVFVSEVTSIYDGDTFRVNINSWPSIIGERIAIRVKGVDTPELRGKCQYEKELARKAKQHTVYLLRRANRIELQNIERGKYFRILADVVLDGNDLGESLIRNGLAVKYDGGAKVEWCEGN